MLRRLNRKGQSTLEYGLIIAVVVAALITMQSYIKRGLQGKVKASVDDIGEQFSPGSTSSTYRSTVTVSSRETTNAGATNSSSNQTQNTTRNESIDALGNEYWPK